MKAILLSVLIATLVLCSNILQAQVVSQNSGEDNIKNDSSLVKESPYYKTAEIAYQIELVNRYVKDGAKRIESHEQIAEIDSLFSRLSGHIKKEFEDFNTFNKQNLSKFYLLNTKRVWLSYKSQLNSWQVDVSERIQELMEISGKVKEKENLWIATAELPDNKFLPEEIRARILNSRNELHELESHLFEVVGTLSVLDSRITDQVIDVDEHIGIIEELQKNYRLNVLKATQPVLWKIKLKGSYNGTVSERLKKVWYENTKSLKDSLPSFSESVLAFVLWSLLVIVIIAGIRYLYLKQFPARRLVSNDEINELIIRYPIASILYLILFVFILVFNTIPLILSGFISLIAVLLTFFLLSNYISQQGRKLIIAFVVLLIANILEIIFWYFGNYARLYLFLEAALGAFMVSRFVGRNYIRQLAPEFRYRIVVEWLRHPIFMLFVIAFIANLFGFQNLTVLFLKIGAQVATSIIIIIGAWEISKSGLFTLFKVTKRFKNHSSYQYFKLIKKRLTWFLNLFYGIVWFHTLLMIVEIDTPFYEMLTRFLENERTLGSFKFTYQAIYQFILIMLITWGLSTIIKIIFSEGNFKKTQRLRGVPAAISTTLRLIIGMGGFFLALSGAGIDLTKISILIGAFGVGIGFGLQNIVSNFISGLILIYERPIQVGDTIEINTLLGEVKSIGIRSSNVRTFDGAEVIVPNSILVSNQLINWTLSDDKRRIELRIGVKYGTDPKLVIEILEQVADGNEKVSKDPEPRVLFDQFADSSLNFRLLCWTLFEHGIQTKSELSIAINEAFKENNIQIPFPQMDLHVIDTPKDK